MVRIAVTIFGATALYGGAAQASCPNGKIEVGEYTSETGCGDDSVISTSRKFSCAASLFCTESICAPCRFPNDLDEATQRPYWGIANDLEARKRAGNRYLTHANLQGAPWRPAAVRHGAALVTGKALVELGERMFPLTNFVDGFREGQERPKWNPPVPGETTGVITFHEYAQKAGVSFSEDFGFFHKYYTGARVPSWEDNEEHAKAVDTFDRGIKSLERFGVNSNLNKGINSLSSRFAFDNEGLIEAGWNDFSPKYLTPWEVKWASNGVNGVALIEQITGDSQDTLGALCTDSVFSVHLKYDSATNTYGLDLTRLEKYTPLEGFLPMGGKATFKRTTDNKLKTIKLEYGGETFTDFNDVETETEYLNSHLIKWRKAEKAIIASLMSLTNLVVHVKDLHLELAAAFQAVTVDSFKDATTSPISRLLQPFIHRAIQATNDNFKLLFEYRAAEFSLAPLSNEVQLQLINDFIETDKIKLSQLDMVNYASERNMPADALGKDGFWRWHYRAQTVQNLYENMINCHLEENYGDDTELLADEALQLWWKSIFEKIPALGRIEEKDEWAPREMTRSGLVNVIKTFMTWLSWIHEDVGHSAASLVYNPVYTPMGVPEDGRGIPHNMYVFNTMAYRSFVFLNRAKLMDEAPRYWFNEANTDQQCFSTFQENLKDLGESDRAFSECGKKGFYSCVDMVETGVSS